MKVRRLGAWRLKVGVPIEEFSGDEDTDASMDRQRQVGAGTLQEVIRARAIEDVQLLRFVAEARDVTAVATQGDAAAEG